MADTQLGEFLRARREQARPEDFGLPDLGRRQVKGLRREEVAMLAGISADYYVRLERGRDRNPSGQVIEALARVLGLDEEAVEYVTKLARPDRRRRSTPRPERPRPGMVRLLNQWSGTPALLIGRFLDVLAYNDLADAVYGGLGSDRNLVRRMFLDPSQRHVFPDWDETAADTVAALRAAAGGHTDHPRLTELVGGLSLKSPEFRSLWARHQVRAKTGGTKRIVHPMVGELVLDWESFGVASAPGQLIVVYQAQPGSPSEQALALLASAVASDPALASVHV